MRHLVSAFLATVALTVAFSAHAKPNEQKSTVTQPTKTANNNTPPGQAKKDEPAPPPSVPAPSPLAATCVGGLSVASACQLFSNTNNGNSLIVFGNTWTQADKFDVSDSGHLTDGYPKSLYNLSLTFDPSTLTSGSWSISGPNLDAYDFLIVLKAGNDFAAYDVSGTSGTWTNATAFFNHKGDAKDLSHMSLYYQRTSTPVPGPIAGAGLPALMALGGFVWARRRKAAVAA